MKFIQTIKTALQSIFFTLLLVSFPAPVQAAFGPTADPASFKLSEDEIKALGLNDNEAQELRQFFDALNNLSPEQKKELEDLGKATEEKMRQKKLDPTNFDDLMKFMEEEGMAAPNGKPTPPPVAPRREEPKPVIEKPLVAPVTSPTDTFTMLNESIKHIASLRQKAITRPALSKRIDTIRPELSQLSYSLNSLKSPDLLLLLSSKEFFGLHSTLEQLHKALVTYEPSIVAAKSRLFDENDPYSILGIPYTATQEEITAAYTELETAKSPKAIEAALKEQGVKPAALKKQLKLATRSFSHMTSAYNSLKTPKKRAEVDQKLEKKIAKETKNEQASLRAFDRLYNSLTSTFSSGLLQGIQHLFEKYKPQEAAYARAQADLEKKVFERSKQVVRVPQLVVRDVPQGSPYESFYQKMAQESYQRPQIGRHGGGFNGGAAGGPGAKGGPTSKDEKAEGDGKKGGKGGDKGNGKDKDKDKDKDGKNGKKDTGKGKKPETDKEKYEKYASVRQVSDICRNAAEVLAHRAVEQAEAAEGTPDDADESADAPLRSPSLRKPTLQEISAGLQEELTGKKPVAAHRGMKKPVIKPTDAPAATLELAEEMGLPALEEPLKKLALSVRGKATVDPDLKKEWEKNVVKPYGPLMREWHDHLYGRTLGKPVKDTKKLKQYKLDIKEHDIWAKDKPKYEPSKADEVNLGQLRNTLRAIDSYYETINKAFGAAVPQKAAPEKEDAEKKAES